MRTQKQLILLLFFLINFNAEGQKNNLVSSELTLLQVNNKQLISILDSIIFFSENCEKDNLKLLTFDININEVSIDLDQITITLIDCEGLQFRLNSKDDRSRVYGYFSHRDRVFLISGIKMLPELFIKTETKKKFSSCSPNLSFQNDYSTWIYSFGPDHKLSFFRFYPICDSKKRFIPNCCDSIIVK